MLHLNKLTPTEISLQMADKSTAIPVGICEDVPLVVANITILMHGEILFTLKWSSVVRYLVLLGATSVDPPCGQKGKGVYSNYLR